MFYTILIGVIILVVATYAILNFKVFKNNEKFKKIINKILKVIVVIYAILMIFSLLLPDAYVLSLSKLQLSLENLPLTYHLVRWFSMVSFVVLPLSIFFKNRTIKNISVYFCLLMTICQIVFYQNYLADFTSVLGRGLNSIPVLSIDFKKFLINPTFRSIWFGIMLTIQMVVPIVMSINDKHYFNFKSKKEWIYFIIVLPLVILSALPIYVPQHLFGYSSLIFDAYSLSHLIWVVLMLGILILLYFAFRKKTKDIQMTLLFVLSLSLLMQYCQMFSAISINIARLPFQLCNIGAFLILLSLITLNKRIFNFTIIINVVGVLFAIAMPDLDGEGLFYLYNMHFIFEHSNVLIIPILALLFGIFPRLNKSALKECLICFCIYFAVVWVLGTTFNAVALSTGNDFYMANYLFMFQPDVAIDMLPFTKVLFDIKIQLENVVIYPVLQLLVFGVFALACTGLYFAIKLIYKIKDKIKKRA